jgi:hypothetical protein
MRSLSLASVLLLTVSTALSADDSVDPSAVKQAIQKSVSWLETDMQAWRSDHGCAACHHGPMYLWSINVAKRQGYNVDEAQLAEMTNWLLTDDAARIFPKSEQAVQQTAGKATAADRMTAAMMGHQNLSQPTIYMIHALNAMPDQNPLKKRGMEKVITHLASAQKEDGSFAGRDAWRPIFNTPQILTLFVVSGLQDTKRAASTSLPQGNPLKAAQDFLSQQMPDETQQGLVLRILSEPNASDESAGTLDRSSLMKLATQLEQLQRSDGGWAQTDDRDSDAFATGQALTALHRAGLPLTEPTIQRGIQYLVSTQQSDGTWKMSSRPNPENGKPAEFLNPITYAATAWAAIGLINLVPTETP